MYKEKPLERLSDEERVDLLNFIVCRELHLLHIPIRPALVAVDGMSRYTLARIQYVEVGMPNEIQINRQAVYMKHLDLEMLSSVLHEVYHLYQIFNVRYMETLPLGNWYHKEYEKFRRYKWELDHYQSYEMCGLIRYQAQSLEQDAEKFAKKRMRYYRRRLGHMVDAYLNRRRVSGERLLYT